MNEKTFKTLEFNKIIDMLSGFASTEKGISYCRKLTPSSTKKQVEKRLRETGDGVSRILKAGTPDFSGTCDVSPYLKRLSIGSTLNAGELLNVASLLKTAGRIKAFGKAGIAEEDSDSLSQYFRDLFPASALREEIERCILSEDEIADDASPGLKSVRREMSLTNEKIKSEMNRMLNSARDYLQDSVVTTRNGRYVIPVRAEHKGNVPGMVHDQSSTGATLFIEPMAVVNLNNKLRELEIEEKKEIEKILSKLSVETDEHSEELEKDYYNLSELDFVFAKAAFALSMNANPPVVRDDGIINLRRARHPLLDKEKAVPIDVRLGDDFTSLIVTGPNTGGKTVSLKTLGLLNLMGQAGLFIPAGDRSEISVFHKLYADIGDEQSIEMSLSTFSSHMTNIVRILQGVEDTEKSNREHPESKRYSLVLFDELCSGTDPAEGAALATAILKRLKELNVRTMATTHYSELKVYALSTPGVCNAACEFSLETLSPTYRLLIGVPGKSNAFAISKKLGLSDRILDLAEKNMTEETRDFETLISDLEEKRVQMESDRDILKRDREETETLKREISEERKKQKETRQNLLSDANAEAARIIKEAKDRADQLIKDLNKISANNPDISKLEEKRQEINKELNSAIEKTGIPKAEKPKKSNTKAKDLHIGDRVKILSMDMNGTVHAIPDKKGDLTVQVGIMKSKVNISDVIRIADGDDISFDGKKVATRPKKTGGHKPIGGKPTYSKASSISPEIMLLGMTVDEALITLDKYLDDAYMSHLQSVRVVHGKGTGALRSAVHEHLRKMKNVSEYRLGEFGEGDAGVTIVTFK